MTRVQVNNVRLSCRPEKADELRQELLEAARQIEDGQDWKKIAEKIGSNDKWGVFSHGGARKGSGYCPSRPGSSSAIGGIVDSGAAGQHISVSSSAGSSSAIGGVAASITQTSRPIRRRVRIKSKGASIVITAETPAIGGVEASLPEAPLTPRTDAWGLEPSAVGSKSPSTVIDSKASADNNKTLAIGSVDASLPGDLCTPRADAQRMEASDVGKSPASETIGSTSPAIGGNQRGLPQVLPATQSVGLRWLPATYTVIERIAGGTFGDV